MDFNGKTLSMHNEAIWKGTYDDNGTLLKIHENAYTIGYSALLAPDGTKGGSVLFGDGVFYDASKKDNKIYAGAPTASGATPVFAGVICREPALASTYPAKNNKVQEFQNSGMIVKEGFLIYKKAYIMDSTMSATKLNTYDNVNYGTNFYIRKADGVAYFGTTQETAGDILAGSVVALNPDDKSVTVYVSPAITKVTA